MTSFPKKLASLLEKRKSEYNFRSLSLTGNNLVDFSSNDYLGFSFSPRLKELKEQFIARYGIKQEGSTGSRLLTGNNKITTDCEQFIAQFHQTEKALLFNSGYDANVGLLSSLPRRGDVILCDELCHASIIDGIRLSFAYAYKFRHNDLVNLEQLLAKNKKAETIYVVTESVFSMDGDCSPLKKIVQLCEKYNAFLVVDEAHATGVFGRQGRGLCNELGIEEKCLARIYTCGKALGVHGAVVVGNNALYDYLVNFARPFIYTTALPPGSVASVFAAYSLLTETNFIADLQKNISLFNSLTSNAKNKIPSNSAIHCFLVPGNENCSKASALLQSKGFDVRAIKSPTVKQDRERLRVCLHAFNTEEEIRLLVESLRGLG